MGLFGSKKTGTLSSKDLEEMVDKYFKRRSIDAAGHQIPPDQGQGWWLDEGSARVYILLEEDHRGLSVRVTSSIVRCPAGTKESLYQYLLEVNRDLNACGLALLDDLVLVTTSRSVKGLDQEELNDMIWNVSYVSDKLDDELVTRFGATICTK